MLSTDLLDAVVDKDPFLSPTPDGLDITGTFLRKILLANHRVETQSRGLPDPSLRDALRLVHAIRGLIVAALEPLDPTLFTQKITLQWDLRMTDQPPYWTVDKKGNVPLSRSEIKMLYYHADLIREFLLAKEDALRLVEIDKIHKHLFRLKVEFHADHDDDDDDDDDDDEDDDDDDDDDDDNDNDDEDGEYQETKN